MKLADMCNNLEGQGLHQEQEQPLPSSLPSTSYLESEHTWPQGQTRSQLPRRHLQA